MQTWTVHGKQKLIFSMYGSHVLVVWFMGRFIQHLASEHHCVGLKILVAHGISVEFKWDYILGLQMTRDVGGGGDMFLYL